MTHEQQETVAALIVLDEARKGGGDMSAEDLYERCLARGVDLRVGGKPLAGPYRTPETPSRPPRPDQTAYLCMEHRMGPGRVPMFRGFRIFSCEPWNLSGQSAAHFHTLYYQVSAPTFDEAQKRLLDVCRDFKPLQWIWPYVNPAREAHEAQVDHMLEVDRVAEQQVASLDLGLHRLVSALMTGIEEYGNYHYLPDEHHKDCPTPEQGGEPGNECRCGYEAFHALRKRGIGEP